MNDMTSANHQTNIVANPFGSISGNLASSIGNTATSTHELAEMQAGIFLAKQFPRDQRQATENILTACQRPGLASVAVYSYSRGGSNIAGASIRLAEEIARNWGNLECGWNELEREYDKSKVRAFAWDKETNVLKTLVFYVPHYRTTKLERKRITEERDLYELLANQAARRMRNCILALIPGDVIDAAVEQCQRTMITRVDISPESIKKLVETFATFGVSKAQIEKRIQRRIDVITPAQFVKMREIYTSLNDGMSDPADWFDPEEESDDAPKKAVRNSANAATESLKASLKSKQESASLIHDAQETPPTTRSRRTSAKAQQQTQEPEPNGNKADSFRERIVAATSRDDLAGIADEIIKSESLPDEERDALYRLIEDTSRKIEAGE
ncbi:MAG: hypothetical protein IJU03_10190 [Thermoguttaceae bacterium]|nr:hypothetical protein [Thermoguttaceae bacterium]